MRKLRKILYFRDGGGQLSRGKFSLGPVFLGANFLAALFPGAFFLEPFMSMSEEISMLLYFLADLAVCKIFVG